MNGQTRSINHLLLIAASGVIIIAGLRAGSDLLTPILLAAFITAITNPAVGWLQARGAPRWASVVAVIAATLVIGVLLILMVGLSLQELHQRLPDYGSLSEARLDRFNQWLKSHNIDLTAALKGLPLKGQLLEMIRVFVFGALGVLSSLGFTLLLFAFMLISIPWFEERMNRGPGGLELLAAVHETNVRVVRVMRIRAALGLAAALCDVVLLWFIGVPFVLLWGVLSFLLSFIPNIGFLLSLLPPAVLALLQFGPKAAVLVVIGYIGINSLFDSIISPRLIGRGLGMAPVTSLLSTVFWAWVLGPVGVVLSEMLTQVLVRLVLDRYPDARALGHLISDDV